MAITINGSGITSANIADGTITASDISASEVKNLKSGRKNLIINGGFDVWQRGTSFTPAPAYNYSADRARLSSGSVVNITKESATLDGDTVNTIKHSIISPSVDAAVRYDQRIEEFDYFKNKTFTLSFWVKASRTHALDSSYIFFGGGGEGINTYTLSLGNATTTWTKKTVTFTVGNLATATGTYGDLVIGITSDGSSIDIEYAQVQLELGSVATDFEHRSYGEELALCQRYYQTLGEGSTSGFRFTQRSTTQYPNNYCESFDLGTTMRALPTVTATYLDFHKPGIRYDAITSVSATSRNKRVVELSVNVSTTDNQLITGEVRTLTLTADAEL